MNLQVSGPSMFIHKFSVTNTMKISFVGRAWPKKGVITFWETISGSYILDTNKSQTILNVWRRAQYKNQ